MGNHGAARGISERRRSSYSSYNNHVYPLEPDNITIMKQIRIKIVGIIVGYTVNIFGNYVSMA